MWLNHQGNIFGEVHPLPPLADTSDWGWGMGVSPTQAIFSQASCRFPSAKWVDPDHAGHTDIMEEIFTSTEEEKED